MALNRRSGLFAGLVLPVARCFFIFRNLPVGVRSGMAANCQLDPSLDEASTTLRASTWQTLVGVVLPVLKPAIAYSTRLIVLMVAAIGIIQLAVGERRLGRRKAGQPTAKPAPV